MHVPVSTTGLAYLLRMIEGTDYHVKEADSVWNLVQAAAMQRARAELKSLRR